MRQPLRGVHKLLSTFTSKFPILLREITRTVAFKPSHKKQTIKASSDQFSTCATAHQLTAAFLGRERVLFASHQQQQQRTHLQSSAGVCECDATRTMTCRTGSPADPENVSFRSRSLTSWSMIAFTCHWRRERSDLRDVTMSTDRSECVRRFFLVFSFLVFMSGIVSKRRCRWQVTGSVEWGGKSAYLCQRRRRVYRQCTNVVLC